MAVKKIITVPNPLLRQKTHQVRKFDKKLHHLVKDLIDTAKNASDPEGVGLSAIQIGEAKRVFVIKQGKKFEAIVNPKITKKSKKKFSQVLKKDEQFLEGCLSVPDYFALVDRPFKIELEWHDLKGKTKKAKFENKPSAYVQHELDHLNGILFTDRALKQGQKIYQIEKDESGQDELVEVKLG
jgi:peptide deformylase